MGLVTWKNWYVHILPCAGDHGRRSFPFRTSQACSSRYSGISKRLRVFKCLYVQDEVVLVETSDAEGSSAQIIYRNGGIVDAQSLENLCDKVCHQLSHTMLCVIRVCRSYNLTYCICRWAGRGGRQRKWRLRSGTAT